jgi:hypothetical protein
MLALHAWPHTLALHAWPHTLALHAWPRTLILPSSPYPLPKARRPDEPAKSEGAVWVVGSGWEKKMAMWTVILMAQAKIKEWWVG